MADATKISAQQRAQYFAMSTRQNMHMLSKKTITDESQTISFEFPKSRYLSNVWVRVKMKLKATHASKTSTAVTNLDLAKIIRRVSLNLNTGFQPFVVTGKELLLYNLVACNANTVLGDIGESYNKKVTTLTASASGAENTVEMTFQLPVTLNGRDMPGLILLQNESTTVTLDLDIGMGSDITSDVTLKLTSMEISPMLETFSIPANEVARPDLSVLKLVNGRTEDIPAEGQKIVKMSIGTIYRKIIMMFYDNTGAAASNDYITSNLDIVFNQADNNYSVTPEMLRAMNEYNLNAKLPKGMYVFDFSQCGSFSNFGGSRDLIDTATLTEFWLRFNTKSAGKVEIISECLTRVRG